MDKIFEIIQFFYSALTMNAVMLIAMSSLPKSQYGEATGYFMMSTSLGVAVGPFVGKLQNKIGDNAICYPCITAQVIGIMREMMLLFASHFSP